MISFFSNTKRNHFKIHHLYGETQKEKSHNLVLRGVSESGQNSLPSAKTYLRNKELRS